MPDTHAINTVLDHHRREATHLVQILREIQEQLGWLSPVTLTHVAAAIGWSRAEVSGTASFYSFFHTRPRGKYCVLWSDNITDRMLGNADLMDAMCKKLWLEPGRVSEDGLVSVNTTSCTGMCDQGPALLVNYRAIPRMTQARLDEMVGLIRSEAPVTDWPAEWFVVEDNVRRRDILLDHGLKPGQALGAALERGPEQMLAEIKDAKLRGRGGAGFATGLKWEACRNAPGSGENPAHYVVCNADEGEPGTFKDRVLLSSCAELVFEGMSIAGMVVGAKKGLIYLRGEYRYLLEPLESALAARRQANLLGRNILGKGFDFDIDIHLGAGAYICGEESALIESLEGKPGRPRIRPPFPVTRGYLAQPTTVNNVETLAASCLIAVHGATWYTQHGTDKSSGTKLLSVSGDCERPGIYEYPYGVTVRQVLDDCGAGFGKRDTQAVQISGPSGICVAGDEFDRRIAFEDLPTAGAFMIFDETRDMFEVTRNFAHFFAHESCGFCTPCRVGTTLVRNIMDKIARNHGSPYDIDELFKLHRLMQGASHCGLGNSACNPVFDTLNKFRPAYERRLKSLDYKPAFDLDAALSQARQMTGRDDAAAHFAAPLPNEADA